MIPDEYQRTVRLPVRFKGGQWSLADGAKLPQVEDDTFAELVLSAYSLLLEEDRLRWTTEERRVMFPAGSSIWARVRGKNGVMLKAAGCIEHKIWPGEPASLVEMQLAKQLEVVLRAGKTGLLDSCPCTIPALSVEAASVNEAYTLISQKYETHRRSHTGNVFKCVYYIDGEHLKPLETRRMQVEQGEEQAEETLFK